MAFYIGLMSGTSADAIDAALVSIEQSQFEIISTYQHPLNNETRSRILDLYHPDLNEIDRLGALDVELGKLFAEAALSVIDAAGLSPCQISAIGSHGQTIRHRPRQPVSYPFTLQIGDPNTIAEQTGITTVADFRRRDMAVGGQGAPLVPAFHQAMFAHETRSRIILNIGGIANITVLPPEGDVKGYDTGPGNGLMDAWIQKCKGKNLDDGGQWAMTGNVSTTLLKTMLAHDYFQLPPPKSTGREEFHIRWLVNVLKQLSPISDQDIQASLLELTAVSIRDCIIRECNEGDILLCGGGAYNLALRARLSELMPHYHVTSTEAFGIPPTWVEASAFAWLAMRTMHQLTGNLRSVTGAYKDVILGGVYPGRHPF